MIDAYQETIEGLERECDELRSELARVGRILGADEGEEVVSAARRTVTAIDDYRQAADGARSLMTTAQDAAIVAIHERDKARAEATQLRAQLTQRRPDPTDDYDDETLTVADVERIVDAKLRKALA